MPRPVPLIQVAIGEFRVQFHFTPETEIAVEGRWELHDRSGRVIDHAQVNADRDAYRPHQLLGRQSIALEFENGHRLQIFDSSREFESFTIQSGGIIV